MTKVQSKTALARKLGVSRASLYYKPKKPRADEGLRDAILALRDEHPCYGHRRMALFLGVNKKKVRRVMRKYKIHPKRTRGRPTKQGDLGKVASETPNLAKDLCPIQPHVLWAGDFTYLPWRGDFVYLATVMDLYTREVVGWHLGLRHTADLVTRALTDACERTNGTPQIFHSDQGSEYTSGSYELLLTQLNIRQSHAKKSSPWENGYQESFYNQFKLELGATNQYQELGQLMEAVYRQIWYYNERRIHLALKTTPQDFHKQKQALLGPTNP